MCMKQEKRIPWELIISNLEQEISTNGEQALSEWLSDPKNQEVFDEIRAVWQAVQSHESQYVPNNSYYWKELSTRLNLRSTRPQRKTFQIRKSYQIAACVTMLVVCFTSFYFGLTWKQDIAQRQTYTNANGKSQITLPDGTSVWLHSTTTLSYDSDFQKKNRTVDLEGEAFFEVAKDKSKKFIVHADGVDVAVYGTKFNVSSRIGKEEVDVNLFEGSVALHTSKDNKEHFLNPLETATYNKKSQFLSIRKSTEIDAAWAAPSIQFSNRSLKDICQVLSKRFSIEIIVNPIIGNKYTYTFKLHDENIQEILTLMASINSFEYSFENNGSINITNK